MQKRRVALKPRTPTSLNSNFRQKESDSSTFKTPSKPDSESSLKTSKSFFCQKPFRITPVVEKNTPDIREDFSSIFDEKNLIHVNSHCYVIVAKIGKGGSSEVFKVIDPSGHLYAVKKIDISKQSAPIVESFKNEVIQLQNLQNSDKIIKVIESEIDQIGNSIRIVLELGDIDLAHLIHKNLNERKFLNRNFLRLTWHQMLEAVQVVHEHKIMHCDLKPASFMFIQGKLKLIDFGISAQVNNSTKILLQTV
jgi:hypothetical protein